MSEWLIHPLLQTARGYLTDEDYFAVEATLSEAVERAKDLEAENERLREANEALQGVNRVNAKGLLAAVDVVRENGRLREAHRSIWTYLNISGDQTHENVGRACGIDACIVCLAKETAKSALSTDETNLPKEADHG